MYFLPAIRGKGWQAYGDGAAREMVSRSYLGATAFAEAIRFMTFGL